MSPTETRQPTTGSLHVWHLDFNKLANDPRINSAILDKTELNRMQRFKVAEASQQFLISHVCRRLILADYLKQDAASIRYRENQFGKPSLDMDSTLTFNLSHTKGYGLLAIGSSSAVGIDIETMLKVHEWDNIARRFFHPHEYQTMDNQDTETRQALFYTYWTRKEAFIKALGTGLHTPLASFTVTNNAANMVKPVKQADNNKTAFDGDWYFQDIEINNNYKAATVLDQKITTIEHYYF